MPTVMVTFDKATYVLGTFVHISNISTVTDPILTKYCQTSVLSLKTWSWLCFTPVTTTTRTTRTRTTRRRTTPTKYLSCYWPDFDQTLNVGTWEPLEQIPTVTVTFVHATFVLATYVHIRNISDVTCLILTKL